MDYGVNDGYIRLATPVLTNPGTVICAGSDFSLFSGQWIQLGSGSSPYVRLAYVSFLGANDPFPYGFQVGPDLHT